MSRPSVGDRFPVGAVGDAQKEHVLEGKTFSSEVEGVNVEGTMINRGGVVITPGISNQSISTGYHNGEGYVKGDVNLVSANIKSGVSIFGVEGNFLHTLYSYGTEYVSWVNGYSVGSGASQSKGIDHLYFYHPKSTNTERTYVTDTMIDLSDVFALIVEWEGISDESASSSDYDPYLVVSSTKTGSSTQSIITHLKGPRNMNFSRRIEMLDVSSLTGNYYIRIHSRCRNTLTGKPMERKVYYIGLAVR